jgi:hypothetical protein
MALDLGVGEIYSLNKGVFTQNYQDKDGDSPCEIIIFSLPDSSQVELYYDGKLAEIGNCIPISQANKLHIKRITNGVVMTSFNFKVSDNNQNKLLSNMATVTINIAAYVNQKPTEVGDLNVSIANKATKIFTVADFTTLTTPQYSDPEGDAPSKLKVTSLPLEGKLKLNAVDVTIGQEIPFTQISSGLFTYVSNQTNPSAASVVFNFEISDMGSGQYTS